MITGIDNNTTYDIAPCYMFTFEQSGILTAMNGTMLSDLGYTSDEIVGKARYNDILTVGSKIFFQTHFYPLIRMQGAFNEIFLSFRSKQDAEIPVLMNVILHGDTERHLIHCAGIRITQRNRYEKEILEAKRVAEKALLENEMLVKLRQELEEHQDALEKKLQKITAHSKEQKQLSTVISHDLQEPLRKIMTYVNILQDTRGLKAIEGAVEKVEKIRLSADRMRYLVLSMQKYLTLNEKNFQPAEISLRELFDEAIGNMAEALSGCNVRLNIGKLPVARVDAPMIVTMFSELVSNSLKFRDADKKELTISLEAEEVEKNIFVELDRYKYCDFIRLRYSDNGIGFDSQFSDEIFSLFRKAHVKSDGLGFGLAYCKKVVNLHNGTITAASIAGKGAEFVILLPASPLKPRTQTG